MDRSLLLSMLTDDMLLALLEGCEVTQGGMVGVIEGNMLRTPRGKVDIQPANIVNLRVRKDTSKECQKCAKLCLENVELENEIESLNKKLEDLMSENETAKYEVEPILTPEVKDEVKPILTPEVKAEAEVKAEKADKKDPENKK